MRKFSRIYTLVNLDICGSLDSTSVIAGVTELGVYLCGCL